MLGCGGTAGGCCDGNPVKSDPYKGGAEGQVLPLSGLPPHAETDGPMEERSRRPTGLLTHAHTHAAKWMWMWRFSIVSAGSASPGHCHSMRTNSGDESV